MRSLVLAICRSAGKKRRTSGISDFIILISCSYLCKTWLVLIQFLCESDAAAADAEDSVTEAGFVRRRWLSSPHALIALRGVEACVKHADAVIERVTADVADSLFCSPLRPLDKHNVMY